LNTWIAPPNRTERDAVAALFKFADTFDQMTIGTADNFSKNPPSIGFDACAQGLFVEWYTDFMKTQREHMEINNPEHFVGVGVGGAGAKCLGGGYRAPQMTQAGTDRTDKVLLAVLSVRL
jgi:hypothetical protein